MVIVGSNHFNQEFEEDITFLDPKDYNIEHSLRINGALLEALGFDYEYVLINPGSLPPIDFLLNRTVVFTADLTHHKINQNKTIQEEDLLISDLLRGTFVGEMYEHLPIDSYVELTMLSNLVTRLGLLGSMTCYTDSLGRRKGWSTREANPAVSYLGVTYLSSPIISLGEYELLRAYARTLITSQLKNHPIPTYPTWSQMNRLTNGVFVGIKEGTETRACTGYYESYGSKDSTRSLVDNVKKAAPATILDAVNRWNTTLTPEYLNGVKVYIDILYP